MVYFGKRKWIHLTEEEDLQRLYKTVKSLERKLLKKRRCYANRLQPLEREWESCAQTYLCLNSQRNKEKNILCK